MTDIDLKGHFSLHRRIWSSEISPYRIGRKFTDFEAWVYLISEASFQDRTVEFRGYKVNVKRGELITSTRELADAWKWDKKTVAKTLGFWAGGERPMISLDNTYKQWTTIKVNRYEDYQGGKAKEIPTSSPPDPPPLPHQFPTLSNRKNNEKRINELPPTPTGEDIAFENFWDEYPKKVGKAAAKRHFIRKSLAAKLDEILKGVRAYKTTGKWDTQQFIPNPLTFLNQERWNDEVQPAATLANTHQVGIVDKILAAERIISIFDPGDIRCGKDYQHAGGGKGVDAFLIHRQTGERIRAGDYKVI